MATLQIIKSSLDSLEEIQEAVSTASSNLTFTNISKEDEARAADYLIENFEKELYENDIESIVRKIHLLDVAGGAIITASYKILDEELPEGLLANQGNRIYDCQFISMEQLTQVDIPKNIQFIGGLSFLDCTGLTTITIPDSVTSIGNHAFNHCTKLTSITIPDSVTSIGNNAFEGCTGLTSIIISNSMTVISPSLFAYCNGLTSITYRGTKEQWSKIDKKENWDHATGDYIIHCTNGDITKQ